RRESRRRCRGCSPRGQDEAMTSGGEVRIDVLKRLAEQAMTDPAFRAAARDDLIGALAAFGYDLNDQEMELVAHFRASLDEAGIDLNLVETLAHEHLAALQGH
ncbi:MAG: hypothetical protein M3Q71_12430, partial [Chloroflexota bacterium]|nr:hypothetical protein [Chloroflexota bacterium]